MKKCPNCSSIFEDNLMIKCTNCGTDLVEEAPVNEPMPQPEPQANAYQPQPPYGNYNQYNTYNNPPQFKYCTNCGNQCDPKAVICVKCGKQFPPAEKVPAADDKPSGGLKFLCFLFPIIGLVLYLVYMNDRPVSAKAYGKMALIGFIVEIVLYVLFFIGTFVFALIFAPSSPAEIYGPYDYYTYGNETIYYSMVQGITSIFR